LLTLEWDLWSPLVMRDDPRPEEWGPITVLPVDPYLSEESTSLMNAKWGKPRALPRPSRRSKSWEKLQATDRLKRALHAFYEAGN
jgi:hypothetical protein